MEYLNVTKRERPLRVLVDTLILKENLAGLGTYVRGLVDALYARDDLELVILTDDGSAFGQMGCAEVVRTRSHHGRATSRQLWRERNLASVLKTMGAQVLLEPAHELPVRQMPVPSVMVVHDVGPLVAPALYGLRRFARYRALLPRHCRDAAAVVCVSRATQLELYASVGCGPPKSTVIGQGFQPLSHRAEGISPTSPYILYVGTLLPHKNLSTLLRAIALTTELTLRVAGPLEGDDRRAWEHSVQSLGLCGRVFHEGFVSSEKLSALYAGATAYVFPSLYEGFGIPILEAMAHGVPVIASGIPALREIGGEAVTIVDDMLDPDVWSAAIGHLARDPQKRKDQIDKGRARVAEYSWQRVADSFGDLLWTVAGKSA